MLPVRYPFVPLRAPSLSELEGHVTLLLYGSGAYE